MIVMTPNLNVKFLNALFLNFKPKKNLDFFKAKLQVVEIVTTLRHPLPNCTKFDSYQTRVKFESYL